MTENKGFKAEIVNLLRDALASTELWLAFDDYLAETLENKEIQLLIGYGDTLLIHTKPYDVDAYSMPFTVDTLFSPRDSNAEPIIRSIDLLIEQLTKRKQEILAASGIAISAKT